MNNAIAKSMAAVLVATTLLTGCGNYANPPYSSTECVGQNVDKLGAEFEKAGFTDIVFTESDTADAQKDGKAMYVKIGNHTSFETSSSFKPDNKIVIQKYVLTSIEPTLDVEVGGKEGWPEFTVKTNLPDKTILTLTLSDDNYYDEQQNVTVRNGQATSKKFQEENGLPLAGDYTLVIVMKPSEQKGGVKKKIGEKGDTLTGNLIETDSTDNSKYVFYETSYHSKYTKGEIESALSSSKKYTLEEIALSIEKDIIMNMDGTGIDYTVKADDGGINVTFYSDDFTLVAAAAKLGDNDSLKEWENMTEGIRAMSERLQKNYVEEAGYTDKFVVVNIAPDKKSDKVFYQAASGTVLYDTVSGK